MTALAFRAVGLIALVMLLGGCATIASRSEYPVKIFSRPEGAEITILDRDGDTVFTGKTPATVTLKAGAGNFVSEDYIVTFRRPGHPPFSARIQVGLDGWYLFGNLFSAGPIGWFIVDPTTGAMWTLKDVDVNLDSPSPATSE